MAEDGRYLLQLRDDFTHIHLPAHWALFGGALETGETPSEALYRELYEELELRIDKARLVTVIAQAMPVIGQIWRVHFFEVPITIAATETLRQHEGAGRSLFRLEDAMRLDRIAPWDLSAMMIHARRGALWRAASPG